MPNPNKTLTKHTCCEQLGVCQAHGTCTQCLVAAQRYPYAPGVIDAPEPRSYVVAVACVVALALVCLGSCIWAVMSICGISDNLWLLAA